MKHFFLFVSLLGFCLPTFSQNRIWEFMPFTLNQSPRFFYEDTLNDEFIILGNFWEVDDSLSQGIIRYDGQNYTRPFLNRSFVQTPIHAFRLGNTDTLCYGGFGGLGCESDSNFFWLDSLSIVVYGSAHYQDELFIHGQFDTLAGVGTGGIISWDGSQFENPLGLDSVIEAEDDQVISMAVFQDELYVGGNINLPNPHRELLRWDGNKWTDVGGGIPTGSAGLVWDMVVYKGSLYVGGAFYKFQGAPGDNIARWDGQRWHEVGGGIGLGNVTGSGVKDMMVYNDELWVVGTFKDAGGVPTHHIAKWDGERWCGLGTDFEGSLGNIGVFQDTIYVGGGIRSLYADSTRRWMLKLLDHTYVDSCGPRIVASNLPKQGNSFQLFPNPAHDQITLEAEGIDINDIQLFDLQGKRLHPPIKYLPSRKQYKLHVSSLARGLYLLKAGNHVQKVWLQ